MTTQVSDRRARLYVTHVDPWSIAKVGFMLAVAVGVIIIVAVAFLWIMLNGLGVFGAVSRNVNDIVGSSEADFDLMGLLSFTRVVGTAIVIASVEVVLVSVLSGVFAVLYNLTVRLTGGVEVVLTDRQS